MRKHVNFRPTAFAKCTRNLFMNHDIECSTNLQNNENTVKEKNHANFVFAPALTENHLHPNVKQQIRVKLDAQIFSHSVAGGILARIAFNELPSEAHTTTTCPSQALI